MRAGCSRKPGLPGLLSDRLRKSPGREDAHSPFPLVGSRRSEEGLGAAGDLARERKRPPQPGRPPEVRSASFVAWIGTCLSGPASGQRFGTRRCPRAKGRGPALPGVPCPEFLRRRRERRGHHGQQPIWCGEMVSGAGRDALPNRSRSTGVASPFVRARRLALWGRPTGLKTMSEPNRRIVAEDIPVTRVCGRYSIDVRSALAHCIRSFECHRYRSAPHPSL